MIKQLNISLYPKQASIKEIYTKFIAKKLGVAVHEINKVVIRRRSIDARGRSVKINLGVEVFIGEEPKSQNKFNTFYQNVEHADSVVIVGAGPAGLFAALRLIEYGIKPIVVERGKDVSARKRDIASLHKNEKVNPDSNYGFGEGGAGTFSDGKLYTRSKKRGNVKRVLGILHEHGAQDDILIDAHPHIGTNYLPRIIASMRESIKEYGGQIQFNSRVVDFIIDDDKVNGVVLQNGDKIDAKAVILATGHSARDIYRLLQEKGIHIEGKDFAMGVRIEHPQALIDSIQYSMPARGKYLPPATYSFVEQVNGRGVYSFCMCPGGFIVPAATDEGQLVVNGMSPSERSGKFANSGMVVEVKMSDIMHLSKSHEFAGLKFQEDLERKAFEMSGNNLLAPSQRLTDFLTNKETSSLPDSSYRPGLLSSDLHAWLPGFISQSLKDGIQAIGRKANGFVSEEAVIVGVESRTSSPVRIPRDPETFQHVKFKGIYPCGEGAGYSGGIASSAIDGERCAEKVALELGASPPEL